MTDPSASTRPLRFLITEEALQSGGGHWSSYIGDIASGLRTMGDEVDVAVHRDASKGVVNRVGGSPWFSRNCWIGSESQGAVGGIRHNLTFRKELASWLKRHDPYDWICAFTMRLQHLLAFALLARSSAVPKQTRFFLLFVQGFGRYAGNGVPTEFPETLSTKLARFCFWVMAPDVRSGRVVLAAETKGMQEELQRFTGLPVTLAPHPVSFPTSQKAKGERRVHEGNESHNHSAESAHSSGLRSQVLSRDSSYEASSSVPLVHSVATSEASSKPSTLDSRLSTHPLTITCPGFARHEKGTDLFQDAIRILLARPDADRFRFVLQWPESFAMPDGSLLGPDLGLAADGRVEFLNRNLNASEYEELLAKTDLIILPYRRNSYHHRVSRVAIEATGRGIPIIFTEGTWSQEVAGLVGCGIPIRAESAEEVAKSLEEAMDQISSLSPQALSGATHVRNYHSVEMLRNSLMELMR